MSALIVWSLYKSWLYWYLADSFGFIWSCLMLFKPLYFINLKLEHVTLSCNRSNGELSDWHLWCCVEPLKKLVLKCENIFKTGVKVWKYKKKLVLKCRYLNVNLWRWIPGHVTIVNIALHILLLLFY